MCWRPAVLLQPTWNSRSIASLGSSLMRGLLVMFLALSAQQHAWCQHVSAAVIALPERTKSTSLLRCTAMHKPLA
jgi:hypothetical protein